MAQARKQETWSREAGYVWSMIGSAVGFANILSFSALCYKNGGGAFLIPYLIAHLLVGLPMLLLEGTIGQRTKQPFVSALGGAIGLYGKWLGWLAVLTCATIGGFYVVLTGYSVAYIWFSATGGIGADSAYFFKQVFLKDSGSLTQIGGMAPGVLLATLLVMVFSWAVLTRNIRSGVERTCSFFLPLLGIMVTLFSLAAAFLPGALDGFKHYLLPDFSRLKDWILWRDVFGQVFFSLSLGLGIVTGYSRHNPDSFSIPRAMLKVAIGDCVISFISGFAIFGCIGFMSFKQAIPFNAIISSDSAFEIGFVIFPLILQQFGTLAASILGPFFFFSVFIAGVTGFFSIVESVAGNLEVEFKQSRQKAVAIAMFLALFLAIPFCLGNGQHIIGAIAPMVLGTTMLVGGVVEIIIFLFYAKTLSQESVWYRIGGARSWSYQALKFLVLPLLLLILAGSLYQELLAGFSFALLLRYGWLALMLLAGWFLAKRASVAPSATSEIYKV